MIGNAASSRQPIESPCVGLCTIDDETRLCLGCRRSLEEIARWGTMTPAERRAIMESLPLRVEPNKR